MLDFFVKGLFENPSFSTALTFSILGGGLRLMGGTSSVTSILCGGDDWNDIGGGGGGLASVKLKQPIKDYFVFRYIERRKLSSLLVMYIASLSIPLTSFDPNLKGWCCSKCSSRDALDFFFLTTKNATITPITRIAIIIPAMPPPPIPELLPLLSDLFPFDRWPGLLLRVGGGAAVYGGGGGAGPVFHELPSVLRNSYLNTKLETDIGIKTTYLKKYSVLVLAILNLVENITLLWVYNEMSGLRSIVFIAGILQTSVVPFAIVKNMV
jgi:hypothetical protein